MLIILLGLLISNEELYKAHIIDSLNIRCYIAVPDDVNIFIVQSEKDLIKLF
jgi:hypothetical protein